MLCRQVLPKDKLPMTRLRNCLLTREIKSLLTPLKNPKRSCLRCEELAGSQTGGPSQEGTTASTSASASGFGGYQVRTDPEKAARKVAISAEFYYSMPEWTMKMCLELMSQRPPDRVALARCSGYYFTTPALLEICASSVVMLAGGVVEVANPTRTGSTARAAELRTPPTGGASSSAGDNSDEGSSDEQGEDQESEHQAEAQWKAPHPQV